MAVIAILAPLGGELQQSEGIVALYSYYNLIVIWNPCKHELLACQSNCEARNTSGGVVLSLSFFHSK